MSKKKKLSQKDAVYEIVKELLGNKYSTEEDMRPHFGSRDNRNLQLYEGNYLSNLLMDRAVELFKQKVKSGEVEAPKPRKNKHGVISTP